MFFPLNRLWTTELHRDAFCQFPPRWIYYYGSNESTGKETGKTHLCALWCSAVFSFLKPGVPRNFFEEGFL